MAEHLTTLCVLGIHNVCLVDINSHESMTKLKNCLGKDEKEILGKIRKHEEACLETGSAHRVKCCTGRCEFRGR